MIKKLASRKGQVSMEIGILVAAAVAVAAIAAYYYATNVKNSGQKVLESTNSTTNALADAIANATAGLSNVSN